MESKTESKIQACISLCGEIVDESHPNQDDLRDKANNIESILIGLKSEKQYKLSTVLQIIEENYENVLTDTMIDDITKKLNEVENGI